MHRYLLLVKVFFIFFRYSTLINVSFSVVTMSGPWLMNIVR